MLPDSGKYGRLGQAVNLRAVILTSEGERDVKINQAEGEKQRVIKESEAAKQYINEFGNLAKSGNLAG